MVAMPIIGRSVQLRRVLRVICRVSCLRSDCKIQGVQTCKRSPSLIAIAQHPAFVPGWRSATERRDWNKNLMFDMTNAGVHRIASLAWTMTRCADDVGFLLGMFFRWTHLFHTKVDGQNPVALKGRSNCVQTVTDSKKQSRYLTSLKKYPDW